MRMHVGDKISALRIEAGLTQAQLSSLTGEGRDAVPQQTIEQLENKKNKSCRKMHLIAKALGVSLDDLIDERVPVNKIRRTKETGATTLPTRLPTTSSGITIAALLTQMNAEYEQADPDLKSAIDELYKRYQEDHAEGIRIARAIKALLAK